MSALSYLSEYGSNSEESDSELNTNGQKNRLPTPDLNKVPVVPVYKHKDNPDLHGGRLRSFPHIRGNWASYVFARYLDLDALYELLEKLEETVSTKVESCHRCDDFHITLSKTVVLQYHLISSFSSSLQKNLKHLESFDLGFTSVKIYCNDEKSRTFISLEVDPFAQKYLLNISKTVDEILNEFQLPTFYKDPSFHMSVLWVNGDKKSELNSILESMNDILLQEIDKSLKSVLVDTINCKIGNKSFQYSLS